MRKINKTNILCMTNRELQKIPHQKSVKSQPNMVLDVLQHLMQSVFVRTPLNERQLDRHFRPFLSNDQGGFQVAIIVHESFFLELFRTAFIVVIRLMFALRWAQTGIQTRHAHLRDQVNCTFDLHRLGFQHRIQPFLCPPSPSLM